MLSLKELCRSLSVSTATGNNWLRAGRLEPTEMLDGKPYFSEKYAAQILSMVKDTKNPLLKSRRNKKHVKGNGVYRSYVKSDSSNISGVEQVTALLGEQGADRKVLLSAVAECALQLLNQVFELGYEETGGLLTKFLEGNLKLGVYHILIEDLLEGIKEFPCSEESIKAALQVSFQYEPQEDLLGLLYLSLKSMGERKAYGAYYTPTKIVKKLINNLRESDAVHGKILDPCCGTGNFCLQLPDYVDICDIYGKDVDRISVQITRINIALRYKTSKVQQIYENFRVENYLLEKDDQVYDCILGNPPWGYEFTQKEIKQLKNMFQSASGKNVESYDVFLEQSIARISKSGTIAFVLPEAVLYVRAHQRIREIMKKGTRIQRLDYLGNTFDKVQCPSIILQLTRGVFSVKGMQVSMDGKEFAIKKERKTDVSGFNFQMEDREYVIFEKICKISNADYLKENAHFAMGIVTGDNKKYIANTPQKDSEIILKGADLYKYSVEEAKCYISFVPERFQQAAPQVYYRAPEKLLYRFIGRHLVFAYDNRQTLSLNSCNIVIPHIPGASMKYILAVLNSRTVQFWYQRKFCSIKVLRSQIEQIPIPRVLQAAQREIVGYADRLIHCKNSQEKIALYDELDVIIARIYGLSKKEYQVICESLKYENLFLIP